MEYLLRSYLILLILAVVIVSVLSTVNRKIPDSSVLSSATPTPSLIVQHPTATQTVATAIKPHFEDELDSIATKKSNGNGDMSYMLKDVGDEVELIRGLTLEQQMRPKFMSKYQFTSDLENELDEDIENILNQQYLMKILDLIPENSYLPDMLRDLYSEQVVGFYDTETDEMYLISESELITPSDKTVIAHEYTHALQQEHFKINDLMEGVEENSGASDGLLALIEGDAVMVQLEYMDTHLTSAEIESTFKDDSGLEAFNDSPYILQKMLSFPYDEGYTFVNSLRSRGGWEAVNLAYTSPPTSTEQILHPEKYIMSEPPVTVVLPSLATSLGQGWNEVYDDVMGEFFIKTYLETHTYYNRAAVAAEGWGGDRFRVLHGPGDSYAFVSVVELDEEQDAMELLDVLGSIRIESHDRHVAVLGKRLFWIISTSSDITNRIWKLFE